MKKIIPNDERQWVDEIIEAYEDAEATIPFGNAIGRKITTDDLFHFAPAICLKFRGIKNTKKNLERASEAALCSIVATKDNEDGILDNPFISFSLSYLASHYGLELVDAKTITGLMDYIEENINEIKQVIQK
ncbi:MAG: hypothetical protein WCS27_15685 [Victivallaceae bacterium]